MAPVITSSVGVAQQAIDDPKLKRYISVLSEFAPKSPKSAVDVDGLVSQLASVQEWRFQELADLFDWIEPLNAIDAALTQILQRHPGLLLIGGVESGSYTSSSMALPPGMPEPPSPPRGASSLKESMSVPGAVLEQVNTLLGFLSQLLKYSFNKIVFNSLEQVSALLSAAEDDICSKALQTLQSLSTPPMMHRQHAPDLTQHCTVLHAQRQSHGRQQPPPSQLYDNILVMARGWGSRGCGLGLFKCITTNDALPGHAGDLFFEFIPEQVTSASNSSTNSETNTSASFKRDGSALHKKKKLKHDPSTCLETAPPSTPNVTASSVYTYSEPITIHMTASQMFPHGNQTSTAELFFSILNQPVPGSKEDPVPLIKHVLPVEKYFALLSNIRLARGFHSRELRLRAVCDRLRALTTALHVYPVVEVMSGYFHAQPELCAELGDLLRPTVSASSSSSGLEVGTHSLIPHQVQILAVEVLTALVARRDGASGSASGSGGLSTVARTASVLAELGVGKGQYLGLLPTLIRFSLASLNATQCALPKSNPDVMAMDEEEGSCLAEIQSLVLIDSILTLTSAVIAVPSGTSALTECGFVPSLVGVIASDRNAAAVCLKATMEPVEESHAVCLRKFITAQAVQILENAIVTHAAALSAFHDLSGTDLIVSRLYLEIEATKREGAFLYGQTKLPEPQAPKDDDVLMAGTLDNTGGFRPMRSTRRAIFFSLLNCLTVVFHHQESGPGANRSSRSTGAQLRTPELTSSLIDVLDHISAYGPILASLTCTMMSDVMNADPQVVHHVHESGLANSFLNMIQAPKHQDDTCEAWWEPTLPPSSELVMTLPNVLSALALTEAGATAVKDANPFPSLLSLFCSPKYAMPHSRCMLNDMTAIVGTGIDELIRHVPSLKSLGIDALVSFVRRVVTIGSRLLVLESSVIDVEPISASGGTEREDARTCFVQYAFNVSQLLEQVLQNLDHVTPFVDAGGFDALLELLPMLLPSNTRFLAHVSCLSNPFSANLTHYSTSNSLTLTIKAIATQYDAAKLIAKVMASLNQQLDRVETESLALQGILAYPLTDIDTRERAVDNRGILEGVPPLPIHACVDSTNDQHLLTVIALSKYLREVANISCLVTALSSVIKTACQRGIDVGQAWSNSDRDQGWKREVCSPEFADTMKRLTKLYSTAVLEACRIRTEESFESREKSRHQSPGPHNLFFPAKYRLRIVCQDGAVVRDGIDIDSCPSVGSLEMGEIIEAFDRCINSSGVLRYRTAKGWISEHTRGHGREPIAEVVALQGQCRHSRSADSIVVQQKGLECGIPDLRSVSASILSRLHLGQKQILICLSKAVTHGISRGPMQSRISPFSGVVLKLIKDNMNSTFQTGFQETSVLKSESPISYESGLSLYFGLAIEFCHACLFDEKRERRTLNLPLLLSLIDMECISAVFRDKETEDAEHCCLPSDGLFGAMRYVLKRMLSDLTASAYDEHKFQQEISISSLDEEARLAKEKPRVGRSVCASFPPVLSLIRKLSTKALLDNSNMASVLKSMKTAEFTELIGFKDAPFIDQSKTEQSTSSGFIGSRFCRGLHYMLGKMFIEIWNDPRITCVPATILHPFLSGLSEINLCLEESAKVTPAPSDRTTRTLSRTTTSGTRRLEMQRLSSRESSDFPVRLNIFQFNGGIPNAEGAVNPFMADDTAEEFEASEEAIERLTEMGFSRDHALEALESAETNRLELAMEYALAHPPPSPASAERRREARERRRRERDARQARQRELQESLAQNVTEAALDSSNNTDSTIVASAAAQGRDNSNADNADTMDVDKADKQKTTEELLEEVSTTRVKSFLETIRSDVSEISLRIIEGGGMGVKHVQERTKHVLDFVSLEDFCRLGRPLTLNGSDPEAEAVTVVVCHLLLEVCTRYSTDRTTLCEKLIGRIDALLTRNEHDVVSGIDEGRESDFASLCHAGVILFRALPRAKPLVLKFGLLSSFMQLLRLEVYPGKQGTRKAKKETIAESSSSITPRWLSSVVLLLDTMAQPTSVQLNEDGYRDCKTVQSENTLRGMTAKGEFTRMVQQQKDQEELLAQTANEICTAVNQNNTPELSKKKGVKTQENSTSITNSSGEPVKKVPDAKPLNEGSRESSLTKIPSFMPLMPAEEAEASMTICLRILRCRQRSCPKLSLYPSTVIHAVLLLLARVLRTYNTASKCLNLGGAELILTLPSNCRFMGNTGLVTVILRHLLEDEVTLRSAMETEIRSAVTRLHKQQNRSSMSIASDDRPKVNAKAFVQAVTPLICRDPLCFLKAAATSVRVEIGENNSGSKIILLTNAERSKNTKAINEAFGTNATGPPSQMNSVLSPEGKNSSTPAKPKGRHHPSPVKAESIRARSKSPRFAKQLLENSALPSQTDVSSSKKSKKDKVGDKQGSSNVNELHGSPSNHVTCLVLNQMIKAAETSKKLGQSKGEFAALLDATGFLRLVDFLDVLADLVLAIPACAAAIHRYKPLSTFHGKARKGMAEIPHALYGCPAPPATAVSYILHKILPQPRALPSCMLLKPEQYTDATAEQRKKFYMQVRLAQSSSRLMVALCARPGEGRRRVVTDLVIALGGNHKGNDPSTMVGSGSDQEMWALQAWAELCLGLSAPKSSGVSAGENNCSLSWEVVKQMLQNGMAEALVVALQRVNLGHPNAARTAGALIRPLEVFTRCSVIDTVNEMIMAEQSTLEDGERKKGTKNLDGLSPSPQFCGDSRRATLGPSQRPEGAFADDSMLEEGFDPETAVRAQRNARNRDLQQLVDGLFERAHVEEMSMGDDDDDEDEEDSSDVDSSEDEEDMHIDMDAEDDSDIDGSDEDEDDDDGIRVADEEMESVDSEGNERQMSDSDNDEGSEDEDNEEESDDEEEDGDDEASIVWEGEEDQDFFSSSVQGGAAESDNPDNGDALDSELEEGWTRIDSSALDGVLVSAGIGGAEGQLNARQMGFRDAAEAVIGNILRSTDMRPEAIAELEETLGFRVSSHRAAGTGDSHARALNTRWASLVAPRGRIEGDGRSSSSATAREQSSDDGNLLPSDRGTVGVFPIIRQTSPLDTSPVSNWSSNRWTETSAMDAVFGDTGDSRNHTLDRQEDLENDIDDLQVPAAFPTGLFPGGPATATHARAGQQAHVLLSDINLRAVNDFAIDRSAARSNNQTSAVSDRANGRNSVLHGSFYGSGSGATQVLRLRRGSDGVPYLEPNGSSVARMGGPSDLRWSDDGQPPDSTTADFTTAFEQALGFTIARDLRQTTATDLTNNNSSTTASAEPDTNLPEPAAEDNVDAGQAVDADHQEEVPNEIDEGIYESEVVAGYLLEPSYRNDENVGDETGDADEHTEEMDVEESASQDPDSAEAAGGSTPIREEQDHSSEDALDYRRSPTGSEGVAHSLATGLNLEESARMEDTTADIDEQPETQSHSNDVENASALVNNDVAFAGVEQVYADISNEGVTSNVVSHDETTGNTRLQCPPGVDEEVFHSLPFEMQQEILEQHTSMAQVAEQLDSASVLDPEALAALPEDMRREVIQQEQQERERQRQQEQQRSSEDPPADPANAQDMDNASFIASLSPDLRREILLTAEDAFVQTLPPDIVAEAQILRERASSSRHNRAFGDSQSPPMPPRAASGTTSGSHAGSGGSARRRNYERAPTGRIRMEKDKSLFRNKLESHAPDEYDKSVLVYGDVITSDSFISLLKLLYLMSPVRPHRLLQKLFQNLCSDATVRQVLLISIVALLNGNTELARSSVLLLNSGESKVINFEALKFPPSFLIGTAPDMLDMNQDNAGQPMMRHDRNAMTISAAATIASNLPASARGSSDGKVPPVVARRMIDTLFVLSKGVARVPIDMLRNDHEVVGSLPFPPKDSTGCWSCLDQLLDLIGTSMYSRSSTNLEQLLNLIETNVSVLNHLPLDPSTAPELTEKEKEAADSSGKEYVQVPRPVIEHQRLRDLCSVLRLESCRESCFQKVNVIARRLSRVDENRNIILLELASVARGLAADAIKDLRALSTQLDDASRLQKEQQESTPSEITATLQALSYAQASEEGKVTSTFKVSSIPASAVTLSANSSELKLLRVLQTLHALCGDPNDDKKSEQPKVTSELLSLLHSVELEHLWEQLSSCLRVVSVLEGVSKEDDEDDNENDAGLQMADDDHQEMESKGKKLQSSIAGLLTRFLPTIEAFFVVNASSLGGASSEDEKADEDRKPAANSDSVGNPPPSDASTKTEPNDQNNSDLSKLVGGERLVDFVGSNKTLLNALLRANPSLLDKGLKAMVAVPQCRPYMDFDVKRHWFKAQVRRLRSRRHGSLRLSIRRKHVFEDAYHQLSPRTAEEMRGRLHITFRNEEGVDAGGLSREFFEILAREMFNANYALFTATEDGCTFQPNPNSSINPDHLRYFRFVGRIVGKAIVDGFLLDAHFTRSLYKHMLGIKPSYHDMQAIDPDYYKNLQMILEYNLADLGLDLTFSYENHCFGRSQTVDLMPNGRNIQVTEDSKGKYVRLVCQHRMTTSIQSQISAYLEGLYELVKPELISIFTAKELELLISGMPDIDMHDLQSNTEYHHYKPSDPQIVWFWNIMHSLTKSQKAAFLQFVTGSSKVPLEGFSQLQGMRGTQKFSIHKAGGSSTKLVSAHTCFNALDLPVYKSEEEMKQKILLAITEAADSGFLFA